MFLFFRPVNYQALSLSDKCKFYSSGGGRYGVFFCKQANVFWRQEVIFFLANPVLQEAHFECITRTGHGDVFQGLGVGKQKAKKELRS